MSTLDHLVALAARAFTERFGCKPTWAAAAPGRVNLIGEHTDYNHGFVLPMAIDRWCVCVAGPVAGERSRVCAHDIDETVEISLGGIVPGGTAPGGTALRAVSKKDSRLGEPCHRETLPNWARYLIGAMVEHAEGLGVATIPELDLLATTTIPIGSGLSSSAAIETSAAVLLEAVSGQVSDPLARALDCQRAEHRWAGVPCGLMDQLASSCGVADHALLIDCRENTVTPVPMPREDDAVVLVVNSGVHHELATSQYAKRRATCERAAMALGVASLREVASLDAVAWARLDAEQTRCVRHVVSENTRTLAATEALRTGDLPTLGRLMLESHASLRDDYRVSCPELDAIVEIARDMPGVFGSRMTGGGFGGCAVVLASPTAAVNLSNTLPQAYYARTGNTCTIDRVCAVTGAGRCTM